MDYGGFLATECVCILTKIYVLTLHQVCFHEVWQVRYRSVWWRSTAVTMVGFLSHGVFMPLLFLLGP